MGYFYAVVSSLFFALYALPKKKTKIKPYLYVLFMGISCLVIAAFLFFLFGTNEKIYDNWLLLSIGGGILWFVASVLFFYSVDKMGVARASEFKSIQGPIGSILMLVVLSEYASLNIYLLLIAISFIFLAALSLVVNEKDKPKIKINNILIALLAALFYGITGFIRKVVTLQGFVYIQQVYTSMGLVIAAFTYLLIKEKRISFQKSQIRNYCLALLSGTFYYFASYFMLLSYQKIEGSIAFPIIQLNSIFSLIIGIFIFQEIDYKKHYKRLLFGLSLAILGIVFLIICQ